MAGLREEVGPLDVGPFFHGTKAALRVGDLITAGFRSNYRPDVVMNHVYFIALRDGLGTVTLPSDLAARMPDAVSQDTIAALLGEGVKPIQTLGIALVLSAIVIVQLPARGAAKQEAMVVEPME